MVNNRWVDLSVGDTTMPVYFCTPATGKPRAAVLVLQEIFGVNAHIRAITERFAHEGYLAFAPDLFHRQGRRFETDPSDFQNAMARSQLMSAEQALVDIDRVIATLDQKLKVGVAGFCMGGRIAFQTAFSERVSAVASFYGTRIVDKALRWASQVQCPLLMLFGEQDAQIPATEIARIRAALHEHSKEVEIVTYGEAGHAFMREGHASYHERSAQDAWKRVLAFFEGRLVTDAKPQPAPDGA